MREFLRGLELENSTIDSIMARIGETRSKDQEQIEKLKTEVQEQKDKIAEMEKNAPDLEAIKKEQFDLGKKEGTEEFETYKKSNALKELLKGTKTKDVDLLSSLLNNEKIKYEEKDGKYEITGVNEQIEEIKKTHDYLFEQEKEPGERVNTGGTHEEKADPNGFNFGFTHIHQESK